jgi:hypothetical protein
MGPLVSLPTEEALGRDRFVLTRDGTSSRRERRRRRIFRGKSSAGRFTSSDRVTRFPAGGIAGRICQRTRKLGREPLTRMAAPGLNEGRRLRSARTYVVMNFSWKRKSLARRL